MHIFVLSDVAFLQRVERICVIATCLRQENLNTFGRFSTAYAHQFLICRFQSKFGCRDGGFL